MLELFEEEGCYMGHATSYAELDPAAAVTGLPASVTPGMSQSDCVILADASWYGWYGRIGRGCHPAVQLSR
jgi:hypothetical protein